MNNKKAATWLGGVLLAWCGLPLLMQTISDGHADGVALDFLLVWLSGELLLLYGTARLKETPLTLNYILNIIFICGILMYKL